MMPLLLGGAASGKYSADCQLSTAMNAPYVIIPIVLAFHLFREQPPRKQEASSLTVRLASSCALDAILGLTHGAIVVVHTVQAMVVFRSKAGVATWWGADVEPVLVEDETNVLLVSLIIFVFFFLSKLLSSSPKETLMIENVQHARRCR
jgi:hypothetical protein